MKLNNTQKKLVSMIDTYNGEMPKAWMLPVQHREAKKLVEQGLWLETDKSYKVA